MKKTHVVFVVIVVALLICFSYFLGSTLTGHVIKNDSPENVIISDKYADKLSANISAEVDSIESLLKDLEDNLGISNPATFIGQSATGFPKLGLPESGSWQLNANGEFNLIIENNLASQINITDITATLGGQTIVGNMTVFGGAHAECSSSAYCMLEPGASIRFEPLVDFTTQTAGASYSIQVVVSYIPSSGFSQFDRGTFTGTVV